MLYTDKSKLMPWGSLDEVVLGIDQCV